MRFPTIADVSAELRRINKQQLEPNDADEGIDVRLQVYPDGEWAVHSGSADYDQDHRGYWGSSSVPGDNRRFDSKDIARDLIDQAREHKATGGSDDNDLSEQSAARQSTETNAAHYSYTIFDSNPNTSSGTAWPTHQGIEIEADSDDDALDQVEAVMSNEAAALNPDDGYDVGQLLYALVWDADDTLVGDVTYELTADDLGIDEEGEDEGEEDLDEEELDEEEYE